MRTFLAVVAKGSTPDPAFMASITPLADRTLVYRGWPYRGEDWRSPSGRVAILAWDNTAAPGDPLIRSSGAVASVEGGAVGLGPKGNTSSLAVDPRSDVLTATTALTRLVPVFWAETSRLWLVSTRASLIARLLGGGTPRYDLAGLVPLVLDGFIRSDRTVFEGVRILPPVATLTIGGASASVSVPDYHDLACGTLHPGEADLDTLAGLLTQGVASARGEDARLSLSGGRDSRLVAASMRAAGIDFRTQTRGFVTHPDVLVARQVDAALLVPHEEVSPAVTDRAGLTMMDVDLGARARDTLFGSDGMLHALKGKGRPTPADGPTLTLNGGGGESLRGGYAKVLDHDGPVTWDAAASHLTFGLTRFEKLFKGDVARDYGDTIRRWIDADRSEGVAAAASLDRYYVHYRTGRWASASRASDITDRRLAPLFDEDLTRFGLRLAPDAKTGDALVQTMIARLAPALADVPFADASPEGTQGEGRTFFDWRRRIDGELHRAFQQRILDGGRRDPLFDLMDRKAVEQFCGRSHGDTEQPRGRTYIWWGMYTASVLLSNEWLEPDPASSQVVSVPVPAGADTD